MSNSSGPQRGRSICGRRSMAPVIGRAVAEAATSRRWADLWNAEFLHAMSQEGEERSEK